MRTITWLVTFLLLMPLVADAQKETEKKPLRLSLSYYQKNDQLPLLKVSTKSKPAKKYEPVDSIDVNLFFGDETAERFIGRVTTNMTGEASLPLPDKFRADWTKGPTSKFVATVTGQNLFEDASAEIEIMKARIELMLNEKDSVRSIAARVLAYQDTGWAEVPEIEIKFVVKRLLKDLNAADEDTYTTDESGRASADYVLVIPGDENGNIKIGAKIEDHDLYGSIETTQTVKWGSTLVPDKSFDKRTLWATRNKTPWWLLIFPNLIIAGVWGVIFYLVYQILQIRKLGKVKESV